MSSTQQRTVEVREDIGENSLTTNEELCLEPDRILADSEYCVWVKAADYEDAVLPLVESYRETFNFPSNRPFSVDTILNDVANTQEAFSFMESKGTTTSWDSIDKDIWV